MGGSFRMALASPSAAAGDSRAIEQVIDRLLGGLAKRLIGPGAHGGVDTVAVEAAALARRDRESGGPK